MYTNKCQLMNNIINDKFYINNLFFSNSIRIILIFLNLNILIKYSI